MARHLSLSANIMRQYSGAGYNNNLCRNLRFVGKFHLSGIQCHAQDLSFLDAIDLCNRRYPSQLWFVCPLVFFLSCISFIDLHWQFENQQICNTNLVEEFSIGILSLIIEKLDFYTIHTITIITSMYFDIMLNFDDNLQFFKSDYIC